MTAGTQPMLELERLSKRYGGFTAINELNLSVRRGELFALLGPNGAGKTTSMRILMGFLKASEGSARIAGLDCFTERVALKSRVGYLPDEPVFYDYLTGSEIVRFTGEMHGLPSSVIDERAGELFEQLQIADAVSDYAVNYSRGMKKKLALVCALLHEPELLILDEPSSGLDPLATRSLNRLLLERRSRGATIFLSSHLLDQVEKLCERVAIVSGGKIAAVGSLEELRREGGAEASLEELFFALTGSESASP